MYQPGIIFCFFFYLSCLYLMRIRKLWIYITVFPLLCANFVYACVSACFADRIKEHIRSYINKCWIECIWNVYVVHKCIYQMNEFDIPISVHISHGIYFSLFLFCGFAFSAFYFHSYEHMTFLFLGVSVLRPISLSAYTYILITVNSNFVFNYPAFLLLYIFCAHKTNSFLVCTQWTKTKRKFEIL